MRVLITGASGFIGQHTVRYLLSVGDSVGLLMRSMPSHFPSDESTSRVNMHSIPISADTFKQLIRDGSYDAIVHLATLYARASETVDIKDLVSTNVELGLEIASACSETGTRMVVAGTYFQGLSFETVRPLSLYAASKQALREFLLYFRSTNQLNFREMRLFDTFGPGDTRDKLIPALMNAAYTGEEILLSDPRKSIRLTYVADAVEDIYRLLTDSAAQDCFSRASPPLQLSDIVMICQEQWGIEIKVRWSEAKSQRAEPTNEIIAPMGGEPCCAIDPPTPLPEALKQTWLAFNADRR